MSLRSDDPDSVDELYTGDEPWQRVVTIETAPAFLGELEDHGSALLLERHPLVRAPRLGGRLRGTASAGRAHADLCAGRCGRYGAYPLSPHHIPRNAALDRAPVRAGYVLAERIGK